MKIIYESQPEPVVDLGDGTFFENSNIEEFLDEVTGTTQWRADAVRKPWPADPDTPVEVYAWRLRISVKNAGLKDSVDYLISQLPEEQSGIAYEAWNNGVTIRRDSPLIAQLASTLGLSEQEVDDLFIQANLIQI